MRAAALLLIALAALTAFAAQGEAGTHRLRSGLEGVVMRGPTTPVCLEEQPCDEPAVGVVLRFSRAGDVIRVRTGAGGAFTVRLRPGLYAVTTVSRRVGSELTPSRVRVAPGRVVRVQLHLDTGLQ
jgi:hypothetical protein